MDFIQKLFLDTERAVEGMDDFHDIFDHLNKEDPLFRSIGFESASMVIGIRELINSKSLTRWWDFRNEFAVDHSFHFDIGLGWAFAKTGLQPYDYLGAVNPVIKCLVYDGIGYYYGLFKGRNTIRQKFVPVEIVNEEPFGFDEGVGRRLWYMVKGNVPDLLELLCQFGKERCQGLWQGVGIACGYVGGANDDDLIALLEASGLFEKNFGKGIMLATLCRHVSGSLNSDAERILRVVCKMNIDNLNIESIFNNEISIG